MAFRQFGLSRNNPLSIDDFFGVVKDTVRIDYPNWRIAYTGRREKRLIIFNKTNFSKFSIESLLPTIK